MSDKYKEDGVDIEAGDDFSSFCNKINQSTYKNSPYVTIHDFSQGNFRGPKAFEFDYLPSGSMATGGMDGIGTKVVIIEATGDVRSTAANVIAMTAMDITRWGGLPLMFMNTLDTHSMGEPGSEKFKRHQDLMYGLKDIADEQGYVLYTGETAELGTCVGSENPTAMLKFNWCGAMLGVYCPEKMILGNTLKPGQVIIVLRDDFRSNGISSVRKALALKHSSNWWENPEAEDDIVACASPSALYDKFLTTVHGWHDKPKFKPMIPMHLIVHLSGGAFESKLGKDILERQGLSAVLPDLFEPPEIMKKCADWRGFDSRECYRTWNGGQGAAVVVDQSDADDFLSIAGDFEIEAKVGGEITERKEYNVAIKSQFGDDKLIKY